MALTPRQSGGRQGKGKTEPKPRKPRFSLLLAMASAMALLMILLPPHWPQLGQGTWRLPDDYGYKPAVAQMAAANLLRVHRVPRQGAPPLLQVVYDDAALKKGDPGLIGDCRTPWEKAVFWTRLHPDCAERLAWYVNHQSYLGGDMVQPSYWVIDQGRVSGLANSAHVIASSGIQDIGWQGTIFYRDQDGASRRGSGTRLALTDVRDLSPVFGFDDAGGVYNNLSLDDLLASRFDGSKGRLLSLSLGHAKSDDPRERPDPITFQRLGSALLIGVPPEADADHVLIDGKPALGNARRFDNRRYVLLRLGQYLTLSAPGGTGRTLQLVQTVNALSEYADGRRLRDAGLAYAARRLELYGLGAEAGNFTASIVSTAQSDLMARLAGAMRTPAVPYPGYATPGTVMLMDGMTGEVTAAASYPASIDQLYPAERTDAARLAALEKNYAFEQLPVGSTAKVPFAAAMASRYKALLKTRIPYQSNFNSIGGYRFPLEKGEPKAINNHGSGGFDPVDFEHFIIFSNNQYAMTLLDRARAMDRQQLGDAWKSGRSWAANLWRFACVVPFGLAPDRDDLGWHSVADDCSPYLWRRADGQVPGSIPLPEPRLNLRMGDVRNYFGDYLLDVIGGGRSSWTAANLGQAYARILSGRAVSPTLIAGTGVPAQPMASPVDPDVWRVITRGMRGVVTIGTARKLNDQLSAIEKARPGITFFAKTGTSTLPFGKGKDGHQLVLAAARTRNGQPPTGAQDICGLKLIVINLQRDESDALALAAQILAQPGYQQWLTRPCPVAPAPNSKGKP